MAQKIENLESRILLVCDTLLWRMLQTFGYLACVSGVAQYSDSRLSSMLE